jgi:cystathionine gamma-synthase
MTLNANAEALVSYLQPLTTESSSSIKQIHYPSVNPTLTNYTPFMRTKTPDFNPGYGCLMTIEFECMDATIAFCENLNVHVGPHLGAHLTLAMAYVKALYGNELEDITKYQMRETQIRISVGLEDTADLVETFKEAVSIADKAMKAAKETEPAELA